MLQKLYKVSPSNFGRLKFEESWYLLNVIGFRKLPQNYNDRYHRHQNSRDVQFNVDMLFSDKYGCGHYPLTLRSKDILIEKPKICERCGTTENLEREHIRPLSEGGTDTTDNLRYLCCVCHKFRHAEDAILKAIKKTEAVAWRLNMWRYRLDALRRLNPPGQRHYVTYWVDKRTHYGYWMPASRG